MSAWPEWMEPVRVRIEVSRGAFLRRDDDDQLTLVSPLPCPFNYGYVPGSMSGDGDELDAIVLGPSLRRGSEATWAVWGCVDLRDEGVPDPKLVCGPSRPTPAQRWLVRAFFTVFVPGKHVLALAGGRRVDTRVERTRWR